MARNLERLRGRSPALADAAQELEVSLTRASAPSRRGEFRVGMEEQLLRDVRFDGPDFGPALDYVEARSTPPIGIFGVGVTSLEGRARPAIFVLDLAEVPSKRSRPNVTTSRPVDSALARALGVLEGSLPSRTVVVSMPMPSPQSSPGGPIACRGQRGTLGASVTTSDGEAAFLTAGHAAPQARAQVKDGSNRRIGTVLSSDHLGLHGVGDTCADVAVIGELRRADSTGHEPLKQAKDLREGTRVRCRVRSGAYTGVVHSIATSRFVLREDSAGWGDVSLTTPISRGGDSGGPVMHDRAAGAIAGQIVGGHPGAISIVQDIDYLLEETSTKLRRWPAP